MRPQRTLLSILVLTILVQSCGGSTFATELRAVLAAAGPTIEALNLGDKKAAVIADFTDLASGAATLADDLKACKDAPCKLAAVEKYEVRFWDIIRRGHFKLSPKLEKIQAILAGIISSAKIFYGQKQNVARGASPRVVTEAEIKQQIENLKAEMKP